MKYQGSKNRLSKHLVPIIQSYIDKNNITTYIEPFVGGANLIDKINCEKKIGSDIHHYLIELLKQAQKDTSLFPETISETEYKEVKENPSSYPDWYVGLVGFCSFGAKWWGGYPRDRKTNRNIPNETIRNIIKQAPNLKDIEFYERHFRHYNLNNTSKTVIYCDIPYKNSTQYSTKNFPYEEFYFWCAEMSKNNIVIISEYNMPESFKCIWSKELRQTLDIKNENSMRTEKLFIPEERND